MSVHPVTDRCAATLPGLIAFLALSIAWAVPVAADSNISPPRPLGGTEVQAGSRIEPLIDPRAERTSRTDASPSDIFLVPYGIERGICDRRRLADDAFAGVVGLAAGGVGGGTVAAAGPGKVPYAVAGAASGPLVGPKVGRVMEEVDHHCIGRALEYAPDRHSVRWRNDLQDRAYVVVPVRTFQNQNGLYCREYLASALAGGNSVEALASACRSANGAWKLQRSD